MAWKKIALGTENNLQCDISDEDIQAAVHDLKNQLKSAGIVLSKRPASKKKLISGKAPSSKSSSRGRASKAKKVHST